MKKIILLLAGILAVFAANAQEEKNDSILCTIRNPIFKDLFESKPKGGVYQKVTNFKEFVFNLAASYQMYADQKEHFEGKVHKPLILVDGKPQLLDSLKTIPFSKIKSIEFCDDEASRALYGSPAKVGVIFIEMKKETKQ